MTILEELKWRGLFSQCSSEKALLELLEQGSAIYCGFDPTAKSLHVGNLIPILCLKRFSMAGFKTFALVGGATGLIGDPSGKNQERPESVAKTIFDNSLGVKAQLEQFSGSEIVNNISWTENLSVLDFMRNVGKHASLSEMLARDAVKARLDAQSGISFAEFSYMLFQANDFWTLSREKNCFIQLGGSDQFGNMCSGLGLISRDNKQGAVLTFPLLTTSDGKKFGKSEAGAIWLDAEKTSVWDFYQFWLNTADADVVKLLKMYTFLRPSEIADLEKEVLANPQDRACQKKLAFEVTAFIHGKEAALAISELSHSLFTGNFSTLSAQAFAELKSGNRVPVANDADLSCKAGVVNSLVCAKLVESKTQANQLIKSKAISLVNVQTNQVVLIDDQFSGVEEGLWILKKGKKGFALA